MMSRFRDWCLAWRFSLSSFILGVIATLLVDCVT